MLLTYLASCLIFVLTFAWLQLVTRTLELLREMRQAFAVIGARQLSDDEKEAAVRRHAIDSLKKSFGLVAGLAMAILLAAIPPLLADLAGWLSMADFLSFSFDPGVLLITVVAVCAAAWVARRIRKGLLGG